jgi:hypothetical protein
MSMQEGDELHFWLEVMPEPFCFERQKILDDSSKRVMPHHPDGGGHDKVRGSFNG